jgi:hypothetical protein
MIDEKKARVLETLRKTEEQDKEPEKAKKWRSLLFTTTGKTYLCSYEFSSEQEALTNIKIGAFNVSRADPKADLKDMVTQYVICLCGEYSHEIPIPIKD